MLKNKGKGYFGKMIRLTDLEIKIMCVLWESSESLTIQEITNRLKEEKISVQSVTQAMKHLVSKKATQVSEHVLVSNVYARTFSPCFSQDEYFSSEISRLQKIIFCKKKPNTVSIIAALLHNSDDNVMDKNKIEALQKIIDDKKRNIEKGK